MSPEVVVAGAHDDSRGFSGERAMGHLQDLMGWPRSLGHPERASSIEHLAGLLEQTGAQVRQLPHEAGRANDDRTYALVEIVATYRPRAADRFVLATHFDTRPWADAEADPLAHREPVPGANDGTSGLAVLLELAPLLLRDLPPEVGFDIVLFDGEELGQPWGNERESKPVEDDDYCMGSRFVAAQIREGALPTLARARFGIVLDMVGDADLRLTIEPQSHRAHPQLTTHVWSTAASLGHQAFVARIEDPPVLDDHQFLTEAGIPSILLIDRDYPPWHTRADTPDKLSADSLAVVGTTLHQALTDPRVPAAPVGMRGHRIPQSRWPEGTQSATSMATATPTIIAPDHCAQTSSARPMRPPRITTAIRLGLLSAQSIEDEHSPSTHTCHIGPRGLTAGTR